MRKRDKGKITFDFFIKLLERPKKPSQELLIEWWNKLSDLDQELVMAWLKTNNPSLLETFSKPKFSRFKELLLEDTALDVISGKHHVVQTALYKGYNKEIPIWLGIRQFRVFSKGQKKALPKGLYFPAWCMPDFIKALKAIYRANKPMIDRLHRSANETFDF